MTKHQQSKKCPRVFVKDGHFKDEEGRTLHFRGINLGGSSKIPLKETDFFNGREICFVNRPFPLLEAHEHFSRLQSWGLTFIRFVVTWESIEHQKPGIYDKEYLQYLHDLLEIANDYGMYIYIDPHQDVWSRWTGGDGAPQWTLEAVGFETSHFNDTLASLCQQTFPGKETDFPKMIWPTNYFKMACATMFTLFWAGNKFAPKMKIDGVPVQDYLQTHYINAIAELCKTLKDLPNVIGYGTMNEPSVGYLNVADLSKGFGFYEIKFGFAPTPFQGMCLADGIPQNIEKWGNGIIWQHILGLPDEVKLMNTSKVRAWKKGYSCVWKEAGVWKINEDNNTPQLLKPNYFSNVDFGRNHYLPFAQKFTDAIRKISSEAIIFIELPPLEFGCPFPKITKLELDNVVNATHWYDGVTLFMRKWRPYFSADTITRKPIFGTHNVLRAHIAQLAHIKNMGIEKLDNAPSLIGECGIPFNLNDGEAYRTGDFTQEIEALDHTMRCLEANNLSFCIWCYTSDNNNLQGDLWNCEDLSVYSKDQCSKTKSCKNAKNLNDGGRALAALVRPYASKVNGVPQSSQFDYKKKTFIFTFQSEPSSTAPTELFIPKFQYPEGFHVNLSDGEFTLVEDKNDGFWMLFYHHDPTKSNHTIEIVSKAITTSTLFEISEESKKSIYEIGVGIVLVLLGAIFWYYVRDFII